jgi:hypothetical protein
VYSVDTQASLLALSLQGNNDRKMQVSMNATVEADKTTNLSVPGIFSSTILLTVTFPQDCTKLEAPGILENSMSKK